MYMPFVATYSQNCNLQAISVVLKYFFENNGVVCLHIVRIKTTKKFDFLNSSVGISVVTVSSSGMIWAI